MDEKRLQNVKYGLQRIYANGLFLKNKTEPWKACSPALFPHYLLAVDDVDALGQVTE